jgi:predicted ABC-type ATPase
MQSGHTKEVIVVGGPNGAGKTTWAMERLLQTLNIREFVNADELARGLSPLDPESSAIAAARLMLQRLNELINAGYSFAFETTCSGRGHIRLLEKCRASGYEVTLVYLWLPSAEAAIARVARREGGRPSHPERGHFAQICRGVTQYAASVSTACGFSLYL